MLAVLGNMKALGFSFERVRPVGSRRRLHLRTSPALG